MTPTVNLEQRVVEVESGGVLFRINFDESGRLVGKVRKSRVGWGRDESSIWVPNVEFRKVMNMLAETARDHVERAQARAAHEKEDALQLPLF